MVNTEPFNNYDLSETFGINLPAMIAVVRTLHEAVQAAQLEKWLSNGAEFLFLLAKSIGKGLSHKKSEAALKNQRPALYKSRALACN